MTVYSYLISVYTNKKRCLTIFRVTNISKSFLCLNVLQKNLVKKPTLYYRLRVDKNELLNLSLLKVCDQM